MLIGNSKDPNAYLRVMAAVDKKLKKYGVFDLKGYTLGFQENRCNKHFPCPGLVILYARMGLHCYNLMRGTKFQLSRVNKYIKSTGSAASSYYMTLDAMDPTGGGPSLQTFQIKVSEEGFGQFILTCNIARIRGETDDRKGAMYAGAPFPEWPPENPFENHYLVKEPELQDNDWIRLYLELAVATTGDREGLSELEIVNVAIDDERLNAKNATLYIRYNDLSEASDRIAIIRRSFDEDTGRFLLMGRTHLSSEIIPKKRKIVGLVANEVANEDAGSFSLKGQNQSSELIQFSRGFGVYEPVAENKRIKLHLTGLPNQISSPLATREDHEAANQQAVNSDCAEVSME